VKLAERYIDLWSVVTACIGRTIDSSRATTFLSNSSSSIVELLQSLQPVVDVTAQLLRWPSSYQGRCLSSRWTRHLAVSGMLVTRLAAEIRAALRNEAAAAAAAASSSSSSSSKQQQQQQQQQQWWPFSSTEHSPESGTYRWICCWLF
jgi:hypothetical protein